MRRYWEIYKASVQLTLTYREALVIYRVANFLSLITLAAVWLSVNNGALLGGFSKGELLGYFLAAMAITPFTMWYPVESIQEEITQGRLAVQYLPKPISYFWYKFFSEFGWHTVSPLFGVVSLILAMIFIGKYVTWTLTWPYLIPFILGLAAAAFLTFCFTYCIGLLSFWITETGSIVNLFWMGMFIFGGQGIPISFFPEGFRRIVSFLPFRYLFSFPLEIYSHKLTLEQILSGFIVWGIWVFIFMWIARLLWSKGVKNYAAFGN